MKTKKRTLLFTWGLVLMAMQSVAWIPSTGDSPPDYVGDRFIIEVNGTAYEFRDSDPSYTNPTLPTITMGDKVVFRIYPADANAEPTIHGLTGTGVMIHGHRGQMMCHPDIQPGQAKPFLPTDARIHGKQILKWPNGATTLPKWADWTVVSEDEAIYYEYTWIANRRMDALKDKYAAEIDFPKYKTFGTRTQRASQLFGMQMQMLHFWKDRMADNAYIYNNNDGSSYDQVDYLFGIDNDEYVYYNHKGVYEPGNIYWDPQNANGLPQNVYKVRTITENGELYNPWQYIPPTEQREYTYDENGYPEGGFELNDIVTEYFKYWVHMGETTDPGPYKGYMIEDYNTYIDNGVVLYRGPYGTAPVKCEKNGASNCVVDYNRMESLDALPTSLFSQDDQAYGNVKHPGLFTLGTTSDGTSPIEIPVNVRSPFVRDYGFYGNVEGIRMPIIADVVTYTLINVDKNLPQTAKFKLEWWDYDPVGHQQSGYEPLGGEYKVEKSISEFTPMGDHPEAVQAEFFIKVGDYNPFLMVSYSRTGLEEDYVCVGSAMTSPMTGTGGMNITSVGDRGASLDNEMNWRTQSYGEYQKPTIKFFNKTDPGTTVFIKEFQKEYALPTGVAVTVETGGGFWPFAPGSNNYYWTHQKAAQMGQIEEVVGRIHFSIERLNADNTRTFLSTYVGSKTFTHSFDEAGDYVMSVWMEGETNDWPTTSYIVHVKDEFSVESSDLSKSIKRADVEIKPFNSDYLPLLPEEGVGSLFYELGLDPVKTWEIAEVTNVLSKYANDLGPRDIQGVYDRFGDHGGYHSFYKWIDKDGLTVVDAAQSWVDQFNEVDKWPESFSTWIRHTNGDEGKDDSVNVTDNAYATTLDNSVGQAIFNEVTDEQYQWPWQRVLEWCEPTISMGYRNRTGAKAIFNIEEYLENMMLGQEIEGMFWRGRVDHLSDADKDLIELYHDLRTGRKIIFEAGTFGMSSNPLEVRNLNPWHASDGNPEEIYMTTYPEEEAEFVSPLSLADKEVIKSIDGVGTVSKYTWNGSTQLLGRERVINLAELNFQDDEYELKIGFMQRDVAPGVPVGQAICQETCTFWPNGQQQGQYCYPVDDQYYTVSVLADRAGAIFATNGTFFDYYQNCLPGITSYVKQDGVVRSYPDYRSMMGTGAVGWDFTGPIPTFELAQYTMDEDYPSYKSSIDNFASSYPNVMSAGMISTRGNKYQFEMPSDCEAASYDGEANKTWYPWKDEVFVHNGVEVDWTEGTSSDMRSIWCPKVINDGQGNVSFSNNKYSDLMTCDNLVDNRRLFGCTKYQRNHIKFERPGNTRLGRTFLAMKEGTLHMGVSNGEDEGNQDTNKGFTIGELGQFSQDMDYDWLMNLDGGGSSVFFVNGKGVISKITETDKGTEGPMHQRRLLYALMVVPKKHTDQISDYKEENQSYLEFDNSHLDESRYAQSWRDQPEVSYMSFGPSLDKLDHVVDYDQTIDDPGGLFATSFKVDPVSDGAVLFSLNEDAHYYLEYNASTGSDDLLKSYRDLTVIGVGKIPAPLLKVLKDYGYTGFSEANIAKVDNLWEHPENIAYYSVTVYENQITNVFFEANLNDDSFYQKYLDGNWHTLATAALPQIVQGVSHQIVSIDGAGLDEHTNDNIIGTSYVGPFFKLVYANHSMAGAINLDGYYVTGNKSKLSLDNLVLIDGYSKLVAFQGYLSSLGIMYEMDYQSGLNTLTRYTMENKTMVPYLNWWAQNDGGYLLQMEETEGLHAFSVFNGGNEFYALKLNAKTITRKIAPPTGFSAEYTGDGVKLVWTDADCSTYECTSGDLKYSISLDEEPITQIGVGVQEYIYPLSSAAAYGDEFVFTIKAVDSLNSASSPVSVTFKIPEPPSIWKQMKKFQGVGILIDVGVIGAGGAVITVSGYKAFQKWQYGQTKKYDPISQNDDDDVEMGQVTNSRRMDVNCEP